MRGLPCSGTPIQIPVQWAIDQTGSELRDRVFRVLQGAKETALLFLATRRTLQVIIRVQPVRIAVTVRGPGAYDPAGLLVQEAELHRPVFELDRPHAPSLAASDRHDA